ncbi:hypothetical protein [Staphylococcus lutrae]|uniref:Uncharacterized protein n=1 Tax=Staphylococcus lutrae TaxID=155085 RepID=A0AAC9WJN9_9STAP|nr:hypothetical protein [Staphylococcus lutrae]ARJ51495.1 hypothetical protein B5P37_09330 [Staphylococcus lutrae]PNZ38684.1 hypothetical protein CD134_03850 [Staphylococcus lutrae]
MVQNEYFLTRDLNNDETMLRIDFKGKDIDVRPANEFSSIMKTIRKIELHFYYPIHAQQLALYHQIVTQISTQTIIKIQLHAIQIDESKLLAVLEPLEKRFTMNIYHFQNGQCTVMYFALDRVSYDESHNQRLMSQLLINWADEKMKPVLNVMQLKQEILKLNKDYEMLYETYRHTHERMQYAFRTLHQFKRSAWKYKKKYLAHESWIRRLEQISYYQKRLNRTNIKKGVKLIWKKVKS